MQYMSEVLVLGEERIDYDYSDMFSVFKKRVEETNDNYECSQLVSFCMETMTSDAVSLQELEEMSEEYLINAINTLEEVRTILTESGTFDIKEIPLENVPSHLHKFFKVGSCIKLFDKLSVVKRSKEKSTKKSRSKLFF